MFANKFYDFIWEINYSNNNKKLKITSNKLIYIIFLFFFF